MVQVALQSNVLKMWRSLKWLHALLALGACKYAYCFRLRSTNRPTPGLALRKTRVRDFIFRIRSDYMRSAADHGLLASTMASTLFATRDCSM